MACAVAATSTVAATKMKGADAACNRRCLLGYLTEYTEALADNKTSRLKVAPGLRVTLAVFTVNNPTGDGSCGSEFQNPRIKWIVKNRRM